MGHRDSEHQRKRVAVGHFHPQHQTNTMRFNQMLRFLERKRNFGAAFHIARTSIRDIDE